MEREKALQELPVLLKNCFGEKDLMFCTGIPEEKRASELLFTARTSDITLDDVIKTCLSFLESRKALQEHIDKELKKIECYFCSLNHKQ